MKPFHRLLSAFTAFGSAASVALDGTRDPGVGRHIVFLAGDHESRAEGALIVPCRLHLLHPGEL
jgi:hypothetical protein